MSFRFARSAAVAAITALLASPAPAYLYWSQPQIKGAPVKGDEPDIVIQLPGATDKEMKANLVLAMRAGLNVAALQCQFAPGLMTVGNYNAILREHDGEIDDAMAALQGYFKRTASKAAAPAPAKKGARPAPAAKGKKAAGVAFMTLYDQYVTRTYNGFSTLHAQYSFCDTAAAIGRDALAVRPGHLVDVATNRMREFRNSLIPVGDPQLGTTPTALQLGTLPDPGCYDRKGRAIRCKN